MAGGLDDLEGDVSIELGVLREPDGAEVTPAKFADDEVSIIVKSFTDLNEMITTLVVIARLLFLIDNDRAGIDRGGRKGFE